ncbi:MAG: hypothetical protein KI793_05240 [Rivularia sp. (in: Bacteria)]|nr:hypothetical protein [Rivularia sp. MS3]
MQKAETLAQLICRTVLEFEQRQASLQQDKLRENTSISAIINTSNQTISKNQSA